MITSQPRWGYIENTKPSPGSEKSNSGIRINAFKYGDLLDGSVNYVQANHKGVEPVEDQFQFYATDGKLNSDMKVSSITIKLIHSVFYGETMTFCVFIICVFFMGKNRHAAMKFQCYG